MDEKEFIIRKKIKDIQNTMESNNKKKIESETPRYLPRETCAV
jgi:hypothetical protein